MMTAMIGMFSFLFSPPALSIPADTQSLAWECAVSDAPPPPTNTLDYDVDTDPIQELFNGVAYERELAWASYTNELTSAVIAQYATQT